MPAALLFLALSTQWRLAGMSGVRVGIDYSAVEPTARLIGVALDREVFLDLRAMELEALQTLTDQRDKRR